jgi:hypothetical protein
MKSLDEMTNEEKAIMETGLLAVWREGYKAGHKRGIEWANQDRKLAPPVFVMMAFFGGLIGVFAFEFFMTVMK